MFSAGSLPMLAPYSPFLVTALSLSSKEPTKTTGSTIAVLDDTCGNLIQITHLDW